MHASEDNNLNNGDSEEAATDRLSSNHDTFTSWTFFEGRRGTRLLGVAPLCQDISQETGFMAVNSVSGIEDNPQGQYKAQAPPSRSTLQAVARIFMVVSIQPLIKANSTCMVI